MPDGFDASLVCRYAVKGTLLDKFFLPARDSALVHLDSIIHTGAEEQNAADLLLVQHPRP